MNVISVVLVLLITFDVLFGKVKLHKGVNQTVTFKGQEVEIIVDNEEITVKVNRQWRLTVDSYHRAVSGSIKFNDDGSLNSLTKKGLDHVPTYILRCAEKWIPGAGSVKQKKKRPCSGTACCFLLTMIVAAIIVYTVRRKTLFPAPAARSSSHLGNEIISDNVMEPPYVPTSLTVGPRSRINMPPSFRATVMCLLRRHP